MDLNSLTPRELLHFALHSSKTKRADLSIQYLKKLVELQPENIEGLFLLGSEYAEIGMYDEAITFLQSAVEIAPDAHLVRFQLGLLLLTLDKTDSAQNNLLALIDIGDDNELSHFAKGLIAISEKKIEQAISDINKGLNLPKKNIPLHENMKKLLENIKSSEDALKDPSNTEQDSNSNNMFLSLYKH